MPTNPRLPDLSYLSEVERSQLHVDGWTTTVAKDRINHTQHVMVYSGDFLNYTAAAKDKQLYFWHLYEQTYDCDVCDPIFGEVVKKHEEQIVSSVGVPKDFSMSRKDLARVEEKRNAVRKATWNAAIYPQDLEPLFPLAPDFRDYYCPGPCAGMCKHKRLTVQEAYEFYRNKYETSYPMDHTALAEMLSYVSGQVPAELCDEISVVTEQKTPLYLNPWYWLGASLVIWLTTLVSLHF